MSPLKTGIPVSLISSSASGSSLTLNPRIAARYGSFARTTSASTTSRLDISPTSARRTGTLEMEREVLSASSEHYFVIYFDRPIVDQGVYSNSEARFLFHLQNCAFRWTRACC